MWIMTKIGFYSIIEKNKMICVRGRKKKDLKNFRDLIPGCGPIIKTQTADYRYRIFLGREVFEKEFYRLAQLVTYNNFKNEVRKTNSKREVLYHKLWALLLNIEWEDEDDVLPPVEPKDLVSEVKMYEEAESYYSEDENELQEKVRSTGDV